MFRTGMKDNECRLMFLKCLVSKPMLMYSVQSAARKINKLRKGKSLLKMVRAQSLRCLFLLKLTQFVILSWQNLTKIEKGDL